MPKSRGRWSDNNNYLAARFRSDLNAAASAFGDNKRSMHISEHLWFSRIMHQSRYLGREINSIKKDPSSVEVHIALAFPDVYEIGMSHLGLKILYHILNSKHWISAERVFAPWVDLADKLKKGKIPLASLESDKPISKFDIIGFSLQHELCYTNVLSMLDLAGIPFLSGERSSRDPLIIAGGPACFNPEPVADIFDAIVVGDGEESALAICQIVREWKLDRSKSKSELLKELLKVKGIYIPSFFNTYYGANGIVENIEPLMEGYTSVEKAIIPDLNLYSFPSRQIVPFAGIVHDRFTVEIARGCGQGCRFCQAGMIYRPVRERDPSEIARIAERGLRETGFEDLSLLSLSSGDYSCVVPLLRELMTRFADNHVAVSFSSLRVDSAISLLMEEIKKVRQTSFTIAPEAGSQRLRDVINKKLTDDQILNTAREIYDGGWNLIKLYFMIGLPYESDSDLTAIAELGKRISQLAPKGRKGNVLNVSVASYVPKTHTPFAWLPQIEFEESKRRINFIKEKLRSRRVRVKWNMPEASWLEGIFSRGDRRLTKVLIEAWQRGARFDSWSEHLNINIWKKAFQRYELDPDFYLLRERDHNEIFPWAHISAAISKEFLIREWENAKVGEKTPDCRKNCSNCGVCVDNISPVLVETPFPSKGKGTNKPKKPNGTIGRYRLHFTKLERARYLSHLELIRIFIRAFRRAGIDLVYSGGYHPMPKLSFAKALPVGTASMSEVVDITVNNVEDSPVTIKRINRELPSGIKVVFMEEISKKVPPKIKESYFNIQIQGCFHKKDADRFLRLDTWLATKRKKDDIRTVDIRSQIKELNLLSSNELELVLRHRNGPEIKPASIIKEVFALSDNQIEGMKILKTKSILA